MKAKSSQAFSMNFYPQINHQSCQSCRQSEYDESKLWLLICNVWKPLEIEVNYKIKPRYRKPSTSSSWRLTPFRGSLSWDLKFLKYFYFPKLSTTLTIKSTWNYSNGLPKSENTNLYIFSIIDHLRFFFYFYILKY